MNPRAGYFGGSRDSLLNTQASVRRLERQVPRADIRLLEGFAHVLPDLAEPLTNSSGAADVRSSGYSPEACGP